jgi:hypothetical protein
MKNCIFCINNISSFDGKEYNFEKFKPGGLHEEHAAVTWGSGHLSI